MNIAQQSWAEWGYDIVPVALAEAWTHAQDKQWAEMLAAIDKADHEEAERLAREEAECETRELAEREAKWLCAEHETAVLDDSNFEDGDGEGDDDEVCVSADEVDSDGGTGASQAQSSTFSKCGAEDKLEGDKERP